jgi:ABC-type multidrug transport system ATPase subunit
MLTAQARPKRGAIFVDGMNVAKEKLQAIKSIGVCP